MTKTLGWGGLVLVACIACGDDDGTVDAGREDSRVPLCASDIECDDSVYCNGEESCDSGSALADERGCLSGTPPCGDAECDEVTAICGEDCPDADDDGHTAMRCGGDDCDDGDPGRFPSNMEVCDLANVDEDCDPTTFGFRDNDGDGASDDVCCNGATCGNDCDDERGSVGPRALEICDGEDNDCDGNVDEELGSDFYPDMDGDGFGEEGATAVMACEAPADHVGNDTDCDDTASETHPGAFDVCDGTVDQDCDGTVDNPMGGCACVTGESRSCPEAMGVCAAGSQSCLAGTWTACSVTAAAETCNDADDDCDGNVDEGLPVTTYYRDSDDDTFGDAGDTVSVCGAGAPPDGYVANSNDCYDDNAQARPGQTNYFTSDRGDGSFDYDCSGGPTPEYRAATCSGGVVGACRSSPGFLSPRGGSTPTCGGSGNLQASCTRTRLGCEATAETRATRQGCR